MLEITYFPVALVLPPITRLLLAYLVCTTILLIVDIHLVYKFHFLTEEVKRVCLIFTVIAWVITMSALLIIYIIYAAQVDPPVYLL